MTYTFRVMDANGLWAKFDYPNIPRGILLFANVVLRDEVKIKSRLDPHIEFVIDRAEGTMPVAKFLVEGNEIVACEHKVSGFYCGKRY